MSKFPSLEEIDQDVAAGTSDQVEDGQDFLSRERAVLGDDAEAFEKVEGEDGGATAFEASYPSIDETPSTLNPSGLISEPAAPYLPNQPEPEGDGVLSGAQVKKLSLEDSQPIKEWKERRELEIKRRDDLSESKRKETQDKARKAIDDFYENYNSKKEDNIEHTRADEKKVLEERDAAVTTAGNTWDRIVKLIDTSDKGSQSSGHDKTRFRELLLSLRTDDNAPGAAGY